MSRERRIPPQSSATKGQAIGSIFPSDKKKRAERIRAQEQERRAAASAPQPKKGRVEESTKQETEQWALVGMVSIGDLVKTILQEQKETIGELRKYIMGTDGYQY